MLSLKNCLPISVVYGQLMMQCGSLCQVYAHLQLVVKSDLVLVCTYSGTPANEANEYKTTTGYSSEAFQTSSCMHC